MLTRVDAFVKMLVDPFFPVASKIPDAFSAGVAGSIKWFLFGLLISRAVLRHRMLDLSLHVRQRAARGVVVLGVGVAALGLLWSTTGPEGVLSPAEIVVLGGILVLTQGFRRFADWVAEVAYGVPRGNDVVASIGAYQAGVEQAVSEGRSLGGDEELARLRAELSIDDDTAAVVERMARAAPEGPLTRGEIVDGRYRIERLLGRGGTGRTFLAHDELIDRPVAIKEVLHGTPAERARILREARAAGGLNHPNVVTVHDVLTRPGSVLLVTEHVPGGSLEERVDGGDPLPLGASVDVLDGVLSGLEAVHAEGIVHGDLKPANVLLLEDGTPKLADFGTARTASGETLSAGSGPRLEGTPGYLAPERIQGRPPSPAADIYAAGVVLEALTTETDAPGVDRIVEQATAAEPQARFDSATEMRNALQAARQALP